MKILLVTGVYPPAIGGPSAQTQHIAHGLAARGIAVHVVTYGDAESSGWDGPVSITFLDIGGGSGLKGKIRRNLEVRRRLEQVMDQFQPSVVHVQTMNGALSALAVRIARRRRVPRLVKFVGDMDLVSISKKSVYSTSGNSVRERLSAFSTNLKQRWVFSLFQCVWATTPIFRDRLRDVYGVPEHKILLLPNFIDLDSFQEIGRVREAASMATVGAGGSTLHADKTIPTAQLLSKSEKTKEITLLSVCRLRSIKGIDVCIQALTHLRDLPLRLRLVGDSRPEYETYLRDLCESCQVSERVEFAGVVPTDKVAAEYSSADIFVLASHREAFGIVLIEAMAAGVAIVATRVGGIPSVVEDGVTARLVPPGDARALADAVRQLILDEPARKAMSAAGRQCSSQYNLQTGLNALTQKYQELIAQYGDKTP